MNKLTVLPASLQKNWYDMNDSSPYALNFTNENPVTIEANPDCHYPDFLPVCYYRHQISKLSVPDMFNM